MPRCATCPVSHDKWISNKHTAHIAWPFWNILVSLWNVMTLGRQCKQLVAGHGLASVTLSQGKLRFTGQAQTPLRGWSARMWRVFADSPRLTPPTRATEKDEKAIISVWTHWPRLPDSVLILMFCRLLHFGWHVFLVLLWLLCRRDDQFHGDKPCYWKMW